MVAGLSCQHASLLIFAACCSVFGWHVHCSSGLRNRPYAYSVRDPRPKSPSSIRSGATWDDATKDRPFPSLPRWSCIATIKTFSRSCFRVAELSGGFHGSLANSQISFMVLEGAMVATACLCLTILHPGVYFQAEWRAVDFKFGRDNRSVVGGKSISRRESDDESGTATVPPGYNERVSMTL